MYSDKELLDWLQSKTTGYGNGWVCRMSSTGRGVRLHESRGTDNELLSSDIREAITSAIDNEKESNWPWPGR